MEKRPYPGSKFSTFIPFIAKNLATLIWPKYNSHPWETVDQPKHSIQTIDQSEHSIETTDQSELSTETIPILTNQNRILRMTNQPHYSDC